MQEVATQNDFDYSLVDFKTQEFLQERSNIIYGIQSKSTYEIGKQLVKAQEVLAKNGYGCFEEWYSSLGFKKTKAYQYINHYNFVRSQSEQLNIDTFEGLPKKLQSEMSKPSANPGLNQKVFDGDITTHKKYKEMERKLKESEERNKRLAEQTQQATKEVIKEVVKEVPVAQEDYQQAIQRSKDLSENIKAYADRNAFLEKTLNDLHAQRAEVDEKSAKYDELTEAIKQSQGQLNSYQRKIASYKNFMNLFQKADQLMMEISGLVYSNESQLVEVDGLVKSEFNDLVDRGLKLFNDLDQKRKGSEVLEGELL